MRDALLVIDVISTFDHPGGEALLASFRQAQPALRHELAAARERGLPVIYVNDANGCWDVDLPGQLRRATEHELAGDLVGDVAPRAGEPFLRKQRYSAFDHTPLDLLLTDLGIDRVLLAGASIEMCIVQSAIDAKEHGYKVSILVDACAAEDPEMAELAVRYAERIVGARSERTERLGAAAGGSEQA